MPAPKHLEEASRGMEFAPTPVHSPVFVGRAGELERLLDTVARPPAVALVEGEAGIGKSRLVRELLGQPHVAGRVALVGRCHPIREPFPYGPVLESLRQADHRHFAVGTLNPVIGALRPHLPELGEHLPPALEALADPRAERHRLFRAVRELLVALGPALLVIEDLHWADDGSRDLLRFLIDQPPDGLSAVLTYRREDLPGAGLPLGQAYRHPPETTSTLVSLAPLDTAAIRALAADILGHSDIAPEVAARLQERTAGIPLVLEELIRALPCSAGPLSVDTGADTLDEVEVPLLLREAMIERMAALSSRSVEMVRAAAVLRMPAAEDHLCAVADTDDCRTGLKEALHAGVLREFGDGRYGFRHTLAQQGVYDGLPGPDRRELHRRATRVLRLVEPAPLVQLAYHTRKAGDLEAWLGYSEAAADRASAVGDTAIAVEVLERALSDEALPDGVRARLALKLSRAAVFGLSHRRVLELLRRLLRSEDLPEGVRGEVRLNLGLLQTNQAGELQSGLADIKVAIEELHDRPALGARGMAALAYTDAEALPLAEQEHWMEQAKGLVSRQDNPVLATAVLVNGVSWLMKVGDPAAWPAVEQLPAHMSSVGQRQQVARAYGNLADACTWLGHYAAAERFSREGLSLADESGTPLMSGMVEGTRLRLDWAVGRWTGLADRARQSLEMTADTPLIAADARLVLGLLAVARGEWDEAREQLGATRSSGTDDTVASVNAAVSGAVARASVAQGDVAGACAEVDRAVARIRHKGVWVWAAELAPMGVEALVRGGRVVDAEAFTADFAAGIHGRDAPLAGAALRVCHAILALAGQQRERAAGAFLGAKARYERLPRPYSAARAGEAAVRTRMAAGDRDAAAELTGLADGFEALGATRDAARCRRALRATGVVTPSHRGRKGYGGELSPREREVARLVALGQTNRQIADVLFLSPRTVEQHVAQILRKLRVNSRDEIAELPAVLPRQLPRPGVVSAWLARGMLAHDNLTGDTRSREI